MKTIWKYSLNVDDIVTLEMPEGAEVLTIQTQYGEPQIWALVDPIKPSVKRHFRVYGTGHNISYNILKENYIGTFQMYQGQLVFHLFELQTHKTKSI